MVYCICSASFIICKCLKFITIIFMVQGALFHYETLIMSLTVQGLNSGVAVI